MVNGAEFDGAEVFSAMSSAFDESLQKFPDQVVESSYVFSGQNVRMRLIGESFAQNVMKPFAHLRNGKARGAARQLKIDLWDENVTGIRCFSGSKPSTRDWQDVTSVSTDGRYLGQLQPHTLTCFDRKTERIVGSVAWSDQIFIYERAKPLSRLLLEWNNDRNIQVVHAGLVAMDDQGVLLVAKSGSGKSTASLACLCAGMNYVGEDFVGLEKAEGDCFVGHSLYSSVFLDSQHIERFPDLSPQIVDGAPHEEKKVIILSDIFPERLARSAKIRAIALPYIANKSESFVQSIPRSRALLALAPSSLIEIPSRGMDGFANLAKLVEQVPTYRLGLGYDLGTIPKRIEEILAEVNRS